jgi:hypothetical protein
MKLPHSLFLIVSVSLATASAGLFADSFLGPTFWTIATPADFLKGTSDGASVSSTGVVSAGPPLTNRLRGAAPQIWSLAETSDGTLWAGTGGDGRLLRFRPGQAEETAFDAAEANIFAVAASGSRVYAASSPDGRVYVLDGTNPARPFFDPAEKYIWALAVDSAGRLWVGAGNPAVIYRVDAGGSGQAIYRPPASHTVVLAIDREGRVLAGTESPGRLYRIGADDRAFALLDTGMTEVRAIASLGDGTIVAAAIQRADDSAAGEAGAATSAAIALTPATAATSQPAGGTAARTGAAAESAGSPRSQIFRIESSGTWEAVWETSDVVYDVAPLDEGSVAIGSGPDGRLYRLDRQREVVLLTGVDARQVTRFATTPKPAAGLPVFATANPGRVLVPAASVQAPATYVSPVRDSRSIAAWGQIRWEGSGAVSLFTRSGNTELPDDSWTPWTGPYASASGEPIRSAPARFIQWRAVFAREAGSGATGRLTSVTVAYLPRNSRPVVSAVTVHPPGVVFQRPFSSEEGAIAGLDEAVAAARRPPGDTPASPAPGRRMFQRGLQTLAWKAEDEDADRLVYTLQYRREGETNWRELRAGLLDPLYVWDTTSVPDGRYVVRVSASDSTTNSVDRALTGERDSDAIVIDNTPPQITVTATRAGSGTAARATLSVRVLDAMSPIAKLEFAIDGGTWQLMQPADGLADAPDERYEIALPPGTDPARVVVRATDQMQNVATGTGR